MKKVNVFLVVYAVSMILMAILAATMAYCGLLSYAVNYLIGISILLIVYVFVVMRWNPEK